MPKKPKNLLRDVLKIAKKNVEKIKSKRRRKKSNESIEIDLIK